jgi:4'-phosphopantetheinyl transferase
LAPARQDLPADGVDLWIANLDLAGWPGPERLPGPERERAAAFRREGAAQRWAASRWALRQVLARYLDQPAAEIEIVADERGKPRLSARASPRFNLSHSGDLAIVALAADREIGVDVEAVRARGDLVALAERALAPEAAAAVRAAPPEERPLAFHRAWVRHEARLKCLGVGLTEPDPRTTVALADIEVDAGYVAALAIAAPSRERRAAGASHPASVAVRFLSR